MCLQNPICGFKVSIAGVLQGPDAGRSIPSVFGFEKRAERQEHRRTYQPLYCLFRLRKITVEEHIVEHRPTGFGLVGSVWSSVFNILDLELIHL